jgi:excisionase family DNA binding protein
VARRRGRPLAVPDNWQQRETLTVREVAAILRLTERTTQRLVAQGYIPAMRTPRLWLVSRRVLERLLEQGEFAVTLRDQQAMGE